MNSGVKAILGDKWEKQWGVNWDCEEVKIKGEEGETAK